jgi:hypothetical protein
MLVFFSGIHVMSRRYTDEAFKQLDGHGVLFSLHDNYLNEASNWLQRHCDLYDTRNVSVLFDSGAFTFWNAGEPPQRASDLARICERAARWCDPRFREVWFITLDVMPGAPGRDPTSEEVSSAIKQSDRNHAELIGALPGRILPVFHRGENLARLSEVQDMNPDYICLAPLVGTAEDIRIEWSMLAAEHLKARSPVTQLHGLAATGDRIMRAVDWRSVDSTAWIRNAGNGIIFVEHDGCLLRIPIGRQGGSRRHFDDQHERLRARVEQLAAERGAGIDVLRDDLEARQLFNLQTMAEWGRRL